MWYNWCSESELPALNRAMKLRKSNPTKALESFVHLADAGSTMSMLYIGHAYQDGYGIAKDLTVAEGWYRRAADAGNAIGHYALGRLYLKEKRFDDAKKAFRLGAARGYPPAINYLGRMYFFGWGDRDVAKAKGYLEDASSRGNLAARRLLAHLLVRYHLSIPELMRGIFLTVRSFVEIVIVGFVEGLESEKLQ